MQIEIARYPQLRALCWNRTDDAVLDGAEAFAVYERNWRFVDAQTLTAEEQALLDRLVEQHGTLLVAT